MRNKLLAVGAVALMSLGAVSIGAPAVNAAVVHPSFTEYCPYKLKSGETSIWVHNAPNGNTSSRKYIWYSGTTKLLGAPAVVQNTYYREITSGEWVDQTLITPTGGECAE